jgi:hypothetical protein
VFQPVTAGTPTIAVASRTPASGATGVSTATAPTITFSSPITTGYTVNAKAGTSILAGTTTLSADKQTLTFKPSSTLPNDTDITVTVGNVTGANGAGLASDAWTFHTAAATGTGTTVSLFTGQTPATVTDPDASSIELGTAFSPSVAGTVTAIRFYKSTTNTGTHTGTIWSSTGTKLTTVTFTGETASGWQTATLSTPLALTAGQSYVVSYFAPKGHYSATSGFFTNPWTSGPLTAPSAQNGRYIYSATSKYPTSTYNGANYFVDVVFRTS